MRTCSEGPEFARRSDRSCLLRAESNCLLSDNEASVVPAEEAKKYEAEHLANLLEEQMASSPVVATASSRDHSKQPLIC